MVKLCGDDKERKLYDRTTVRCEREHFNKWRVRIACSHKMEMIMMMNVKCTKKS
jgi:hypothetical protein